MNFKNQLINNVITPSQSSKLGTAVGKIVDFDAENNRANVYIKNVTGKQNYTLYEVPVQLPGVGIHSSPVSIGDNVYIQFNNNSIFQPKIVGFADENYQNKTREKEKHTRKGTYITIQKPIEKDITPSYERWLDNSGDLMKYIKFRYLSPIKDISLTDKNKGYFADGEVGLFNPKSSAIVKLKDDGIIDIFTATNVGVRINSKTRTIEMFGDVATKSDKWSVLSNNIEVKASESISIEANAIDIQSKIITINGETI